MSDALNRITAMANMLMYAVENVANLEKELVAAKAAHSRIEREDLPELMREFGISKIRLESGVSVEVIDDLSCSISEANKSAAYDWLRSFNFDGIIKTQLSLAFDRGENQTALQIADQMAKTFHMRPSIDEKIHPQTLKAFLKERMADGDSLPNELFGIFNFSKAKITMAKDKR